MSSNPAEIWGCPDRFRGGPTESAAHLWGKLALDRRRQAKKHPWFEGTYEFERTVADRVADCIVTGGPVDRWVEFVAMSDQAYRAKTRVALLFGFELYWVFHIDYRDRIQDVREALKPELVDGVRFGVYDPRNDVLDLGDPITFEKYAFPVEGMDEFKPRELLGYRSGAARIGQTGNGFDLGMFSIDGRQRRIIASVYGKYFRIVEPGQAIEEVPWGYPTEDGLKRAVETGNVMRLGPVGRW